MPTPQELQDAAELQRLEAEEELERLEAEEAAAAPESSMLEKAMQMRHALQSGLIKGASLGNIDIPYGKEASEQHPVISGAGEAGGAIASGIATGSALPRGALSLAAQGLGTGFAQKPEGEDSLEARAGNAGTMGMVSTALGGAGKAMSASGNKLADWLMQKSVGMRKNIPGAGVRLVDQGVGGTKGMMQSQVSDKLPEAEARLQALLQGAPGKASADELSSAIAARGKRFQLPSGEVPGNVAKDFESVQQAAGDIRKLGGGQLSPQDLLSLKRQGDYVGYTASGNPATSLQAELGQTQADKAREMLSRMTEGASANALADEQALIMARKGLDRPESLGAGMSLRDAIYGKIPGSAPVLSGGAHASRKLVGKPGEKLSDPSTIQSLLNLLSIKQ